MIALLQRKNEIYVRCGLLPNVVKTSLNPVRRLKENAMQ